MTQSVTVPVRIANAAKSRVCCIDRETSDRKSACAALLASAIRQSDTLPPSRAESPKRSEEMRACMLLGSHCSSRRITSTGWPRRGSTWALTCHVIARAGTGGRTTRVMTEDLADDDMASDDMAAGG